MAVRDISDSFQAVLDRLNRPRRALIDEVRQTLSILHLTSDDLPAIAYLLDALLAGVEEEGHRQNVLLQSLRRAGRVDQFPGLAGGFKT